MSCVVSVLCTASIVWLVLWRRFRSQTMQEGSSPISQTSSPDPFQPPPAQPPEIPSLCNDKIALLIREPYFGELALLQSLHGLHLTVGRYLVLSNRPIIWCAFLYLVKRDEDRWRADTLDLKYVIQSLAISLSLFTDERRTRERYSCYIP